jgi:uncharacterized protein
MTDIEPTGPVARNERVEVLDVLRGVAIFGINVVNMMLMAWPTTYRFRGAAWMTPLDETVGAVIRVLFAGKFFTLFSFLFGIGFSVQLARFQARGLPVVPTYLRRVAGLFLLGMLHILLLWWGDVLYYYAVIALFLLLIHKWTPRAILRAAVAVLLVAIAMTLVGIATRPAPTPGQPPGGAQMTRVPDPDVALRVYRTGSYFDTMKMRVTEALETQRRAGPGFAVHVLAMFLFGFYAGRVGLFRNPERDLPILRELFGWGLAIGLLGNLAAPYIGRKNPGVTQVLYPIVTSALSIGYAAGIALLFRHVEWQRRLKPVAAVGRMALTNYLLQSLIASLIFYGYGLGYYGHVGPAKGFAICVAIYLVQLPLSTLWLRHFDFGPVDWVLRCITYWRVMPIRKREAAAPQE